MSLSELKPCPFCGSSAEIITDEDEDGRFAAASCPKCGAGSRQHYFCGEDAREFAADAWNSRAEGAQTRTDVEPGLTPDEQKAQAARCGCKGGDDYCPCQNVADSLTKAQRSTVRAGYRYSEAVKAARTPPTDAPGMSREAVEKVLADYFGLRPYAEMAADRADLRGKIRDGYDVNEPTKSDLADAADAILALALPGGRVGEDGLSQSQPVLSPESDTDVQRDMTGETVCGFRVAAWRETHPEHGDKFGHSYSEHWSTPSKNPAVTVERLFTETQLRAALAQSGQLFPLLASSWFYGGWTAETHNEQKMQAIMQAAGWWPISSEGELIEMLSGRPLGAEDGQLRDEHPSPPSPVRGAGEEE